MSKQTKIQNMTTGNPAKLLLFFALPLMLGNVFQQMYTMVDTIIVGKGVGVNALASLGAADWFNWMFFGLAQGLTQGFGILISQNYGADDEKELKKTVGVSVTLTVLAAFLFTAIAQAAIRPILGLMNTPENIFGGAELYLRIMFSGIPIILAYNLAATMLRSLGDSRSPLTAMVIASLLNIGLDLLFVLVFHWGIAGAAAATIIAQVVAFSYCMNEIRKLELLHIGREHLKLQMNTVRKLLGLGTPVMIQNVIISIGGMVLMSVVNTNGVLFVAGYTATNKMYGLLEMAAVSYGYAVMTYTGQNLGAGKKDRIWKGVHAAALMAAGTSLLVTAAMLLGGKFLIGLFLSASPEETAAVLDIGYRYLTVLSIYLVILYMLHIYRCALQGLGDTVIPMVSGLAEFIMRVGAAMLLPAVIGYYGVFYAEVLAWTGAAVILVIAYYVEIRRL